MTRTGPTPFPWVIALLALALSSVVAQESPDPAGVHPVLVTVDDLPIQSGSLHPEPAERERITRDILRVLRKHDIQAVGFVAGRNVEADGSRLLDLWLDAGHELGSHSFGHPDFSRTSVEEYLADVERGRADLARQLSGRGRALRWFRFPYLREGNTAAKLGAAREWLEAKGLRSVPVTIDNQDWSFEKPWVEARASRDSRRLARLSEDYLRSLQLEILSQTAKGDDLFGRPVPQVLLLHANEVGAARWDALFTWMKTRGFRFARVDEVLGDLALREPHDFVGDYGGSLWGRIASERNRRKAREEALAVLERSAADWNRGDLDAFCSAYAEDVAFASPGGLSRGRAEALERFRSRYPDRAAMGALNLEPLDVREHWGPEVTLLGDAEPGRVHVVSVIARWKLERKDGSATGTTLLVLKKQRVGWKIVQDASF